MLLSKPLGRREGGVFHRQEIILDVPESICVDSFMGCPWDVLDFHASQMLFACW